MHNGKASYTAQRNVTYLPYAAIPHGIRQGRFPVIFGKSVGSLLAVDGRGCSRITLLLGRGVSSWAAGTALSPGITAVIVSGSDPSCGTCTWSCSAGGVSGSLEFPFSLDVHFLHQAFRRFR